MVSPCEMTGIKKLRKRPPWRVTFQIFEGFPPFGTTKFYSFLLCTDGCDAEQITSKQNVGHRCQTNNIENKTSATDAEQTTSKQNVGNRCHTNNIETKRRPEMPSKQIKTKLPRNKTLTKDAKQTTSKQHGSHIGRTNASK